MSAGDRAIGRQYACDNKTRYNSRKNARRGRNRTRGVGPLSIYACPFCGFYHLGHMPDDVRSGQTEKGRWQERRGIS